MAPTRPATEDPATSPPPSKRSRLSSNPGSIATDTPNGNSIPPADAAVGITEYLNKDAPGFSGLLKQRYTDFLVNEIDLQGHVLKLNDRAVPAGLESVKPVDKEARAKETNGSAKTEDEAKAVPPASIDAKELESLDERALPLKTYLNESTVDAILALYSGVTHHRTNPGSKFPSTKVYTDPIESKDDRSKIHQLVRTIFNGAISTQTSADSKIELWGTRKGNSSNQRNRDQRPPGPARMSWDELGGAYLHFNLYKENKETIQCTSLLAKFLRVPPKAFTFAGTKDRRAVTVQRVAGHKIRAEDLAALNATLKGFKVGDYEYKPSPLPLGELSGNEFCIAIRDCDLGDSGVAGFDLAMQSLRDRGYINYYGLQRFGTHSTGTHSVGVSILNSDWENAVKKIMACNSTLAENSVPDEKDRAKACLMWAEASSSNRIAASRQALKIMPRKFVSENAILKFFSRQDSRNNWLGAIQQIPRNLRLMYVHAYQSYVWNTVASERLRRYGMEVLPGDLVLLSAEEAAANRKPDVTVYEDDEGVEDGFLEESESVFQDARPITEEEISQKRFSIYDVVLPTPGWAMNYPENDLKQVYIDVMSKDGLDPFDMKRNQRETSLSGNYRRLVYRPEKVEWELKEYTDPLEQLVDIELVDTKINGKDVDALSHSPSGAGEKRTAAIIRLRLGTSQYATMALREVSKGKVSQNISADASRTNNDAE